MTYVKIAYKIQAIIMIR